jgi:hypothetical protein
MEDKFFQLYSRFQGLEEQLMEFRSEMSALELDLQSASIEAAAYQHQLSIEFPSKSTMRIVSIPTNTDNSEPIAS